MLKYIDYWIFDLKTYLESQKFNVKLSEKLLSEDYIPLISIHEAFELLRVYNFENLKQSLLLKDTSNNTLVEVQANIDTFSQHEEIILFCPIADIEQGNLPDKRYLQNLEKMKSYFATTELYSVEGSALFIDRHFGFVNSKSENVKRVSILTPVYERLPVLQLFMDYTSNYLIPYLEFNNYDCVFVLLGSDKEEEVVENFKNDNLVFLNIENNLGIKKNKALDIAKKLQSDYALFLDSDDLLPPNTAIKLIEKAESNGYWSSLEEFCFYSSRLKHYSLFEGYKRGHNLYKQGMGSGRVFTKQLLEDLGSSLFAEKNNRMDESVKAKLREIGLKHEEFLIENADQIPIGVKTKTNIWSEDNYPTREISEDDHAISWVPFKIREKLKAIQYED